jgi:hypothetical protein
LLAEILDKESSERVKELTSQHFSTPLETFKITNYLPLSLFLYLPICLFLSFP